MMMTHIAKASKCNKIGMDMQKSEDKDMELEFSIYMCILRESHESKLGI